MFMPEYSAKVIHNKIKNESLGISTALFIIQVVYWVSKC